MRKMCMLIGLLIINVCLCSGKSMAARPPAAKATHQDYSYSQQEEAPQEDISGGRGDPYMSMAQELSESAGLLQNPKIAIMAFSYADKDKPEVGMMVSERLTTRIVKLRKFKVIERQLLENVMQELHLEGTGVMDEETTKKLGKVLGVEAIVTGTIMNLNNTTAEINARLIQTDTAEVIATSAQEVRKTWGAAPEPRNTYQRQEYQYDEEYEQRPRGRKMISK